MTTLDIFDMWQSTMSEVNVQQGGQIRPQIDFQNWYNAINQEIFHEWCANVELNQQNTDELSVFLTPVNVVVTPRPGSPYDFIALPPNYEYFSNMKIIRQKDENTCCFKEGLPIIDGSGKCRQYEDPDFAEMRQSVAGSGLITKLVVKVDTQRWDSCLEHPTKGPTFDNPKVVQVQGGFYIAPKGIQGVILEYYQTPQNALFAYTIVSGDVIIYNLGGSTQLQWSNVLKNEFLTRLKKKYGIYVREGEVYQAANEDKKQLV